MLNSTGFSLWADDYDESVAAADRAGEYPFAGYSRVMETVYQAVCQGQKGTVLDVGFGTATLAKRLYDDGFTIYGIDFSPRMVELARAKMPNATLLCQDMKQGLPAALAGVRVRPDCGDLFPAPPDG